jgi:hypothetical protein
MVSAKNDRSMQKRCCRSCMLPNEMNGIILWSVMSHGSSWIYYHVACRHCREMAWSQWRDLIFRANNSCSQSYGTRVASMLSIDSRMILKWTATILWQTHWFHLNKRPFLEERCCIRNDSWFISTIAQFVQIWLQHIGSKNMTCAVYQIHPLYSHDLPLVTSTCLLQWKKNSNGFKWLTRTNSLSHCKRFWDILVKKNWIAYFRLRSGGFKKEAKVIETTSDEK